MHPSDNHCGLEFEIDVDSSLSDDVSVISDRSVGDSNRLKLYDLKLFGRETELCVIRSAFDRICESGKSEIVFCHGVSGVGKTKLIVEATSHAIIERDGVFVTGKFDQHSKTPFSAIVTAFSDICDVARQSPRREEIIKAVNKALGDEIKVLARLVPSLSYLMIDEIGDKAYSAAGTSMQAFVRLKVLCRNFLQSVASADHPVVFMLDDLQWVDKASSEVIRSFLGEDQLRYVLFVCAYRDDEVSSNPHVQGILNAPYEVCSGNSKSFCVRSQSIGLKALDVDQINQLVASITSRSPQDTMTLSALILEKTLGNSYYCLQFLEMLEIHEFLYVSADTNLWEWDLDAIRLQTNAADNVAVLVSGKLQRAQSSVQLVLFYGAYLGYQFSKSVLKEIIMYERKAKSRSDLLDDLWYTVEQDHKAILSSEESEVVLIDQALVEAAAINLIETTDKLWYKFTHDKVQDSLFFAIQEEKDRELLHLRIGRVLHSLDTSASNDDDRLKFMAINNLNIACRWMSLPEQLELVHLNWEVGELAASKCAYLSALDYLVVACDLLNEQSWDTNYDLCLKVHDSLAEFHLCSGNSRDSQAVVDVILKEARRRKDKMKAYQTQLSILSSEGRLEEAMQFGLGILSQLGIKFPRKPTVVHVVVELVKAKYTLHNLSYEDILNMPPLVDTEKEAAMKILSSVGLCSFFLFEAGKMTFVLICLRGLRWACKWGLSSLSPQAFAAYGTILSILGDYDTAIKYAHLSRQISDEIGAQAMEARCICVTHGIVLQWKTPLADLREGFGRGYRLGMEHADVEYSFYDLHDYIMIPFQLGFIPFSKLEEEAASFCQQTAEFQTENLQPIAVPMYQALINFQGRNEVDPSRLFGEVADEHALIEFTEQTHNQTAQLVIHLHRLILAYQFENTVVLSEVVCLVERQEKAFEGHYMRNFVRFYAGMAHFFLYKKNRMRKHRKRAWKLTSILRGLADKGIANIKPLLSVLKMEQASILYKASPAACKAACHIAFDEASKEGFNITLAIAYDRAACIMIEHADFQLANEFIGIAIEIYANIEATGKVDFLEVTYADLRGGAETASGYTGSV